MTTNRELWTRREAAVARGVSSMHQRFFTKGANAVVYDAEGQRYIDLATGIAVCNTGHGEKQPGEGVMGLSWAFLAAGAQQLVVTQWSVSDEATAHFMEFFYTALKAKKSPATALQDASKALPKIPRWQHPHYWAGFALITKR